MSLIIYKFYILIIFTWISSIHAINVTTLSCKRTPIVTSSKEDTDRNLPTVFIALLVRNKQITLPYFLGSLEALNYPKDRIKLWIRTDHNVDKTKEILDAWLGKEQDNYHSVDYEYTDEPKKFPDETSRYDWTEKHYAHIIKLREEALTAAKSHWADYVWFVDCDAILTNSETLSKIISQKKPVIVPMLQSTGAYSNFWCGMNEKLYYRRTPEYLPIVEREQTGSFEVPMVHTSTLIDLRLRAASSLTFNPKKLPKYEGPVDDIITFATSARRAGISMYVLNNQHFGYIMSPLEKTDPIEEEESQMINLQLEALVEGPQLVVSNHLTQYVKSKKPDTLGFDEVYLINLRRRSERRTRMLQSFNVLGVKAKTMDAVDGKALNISSLENLGIKMLPEYSDPYHHRPLTLGEIGCFMSHYNIWKDVIENQHRTALVFEDDIRFEPFFRRKLEQILKELQIANVEWDLIYLGRKRQGETTVENLVPGTTRVVYVDYSYWTLGYLISQSGAKKLVDAKPLGKMVPVDEYLPIMFNKHPQPTWVAHYPVRNLKAFSAHPLLIYPTHYTGEPLYVSDTEDSVVIDKASESKESPAKELHMPKADIKAVKEDL